MELAQLIARGRVYIILSVLFAPCSSQVSFPRGFSSYFIGAEQHIRLRDCWSSRCFSRLTVLAGVGEITVGEPGCEHD